MADESLAYDVVDVFTDRAFAGNPLAVVYDAAKLSDHQLQAIAVEFNLSETTFPVPLTDADRGDGADYRVRIFTPGGEIPFAGHPTLGTAWALRRRGDLRAGSRVQACGAGLIGVRVPDDDRAPVELSAAPRDEAVALTDADLAAIVPLAGLTVDATVGPAYSAGCGLSWLYLRVEPGAVARARPTGTRVSEVGLDLARLRDPLDGICVYAVAPRAAEPAGPVEVHARVFVPGYGISEDPATGSAAAGLGLTLVADGVAGADGETAYVIGQGAEMGRPSTLRCRVEAAAGRAELVHVAGQVVPAAAGRIAVP